MVQGGKVPLRRCVGCGQMFPKSELLRVVSGEEPLVDLTQKKPGRGAYLCTNGECLKKAVKSRGLERSLKSMKAQEAKDVYAKLGAKINEQ